MAAPVDEILIAKKFKKSHDFVDEVAKNGESEALDEKLDVEVPLSTFRKFHVERILNEIPDKKLAFVHGKFEGSSDDAVVILEKTAFKPDMIRHILSNETKLRNTQHNDIYSTYDGFPDPIYNTIRSTLIYPATQKHIEKYSAYEVHLVEERAADYTTITLPHIQAKAFAPKWVHNILEKKSEVDRVIYEDPDPEIGFILIPDFKWNREQMTDLHVMAIVHRRDLRSIRELDHRHLAMLENIDTKVKRAIKKKFDIPGHQLRLFFHYQPSYYHLHLHISHVKFDAPGMSTGRGHLLRDVIQNIRLSGTYYRDCSLTMLLSDTDELYARFKDAGRVEV